MAAPNVVTVATITGKTSVQAVTTSATAIVSNAAASGKLLKINSLLVSNIDGTNSADITVDFFRSATAYRILLAVTIPAGTMLTALSKDIGIYLEEGDSLRLTASANNDLEAICSYEDLS